MATTKSNGSTKGLEDLFLDSLKDIYYAERKITKALPKMARAASPTSSRQVSRSILPRPRFRLSGLSKCSSCLESRPAPKPVRL